MEVIFLIRTYVTGTFLLVGCRTPGEIYNVVISTIKRHAPNQADLI